MRQIDGPFVARRKMISTEQASGVVFKLLLASIGIVFVGANGFLGGFLLRSSLTAWGIAWRDVQMYSLMVAFAGCVIFKLAADSLHISTRELTFDKILAIARNEEYIPPNQEIALRKMVMNSLTGLSNGWAFYPEISFHMQKVDIPMVLVGPGGIYGITVNIKDPRKRGFKDPAGPLEAACKSLQARSSTHVTPILVFLRHSKHYHNSHPEVQVLTYQLLAEWLRSRPTSLSPEQVGTIEAQLEHLAFFSSKQARQSGD